MTFHTGRRAKPSLQAECGGAMTLLFRFAPATFGSLSAVELNLLMTQFHFAIYSLYSQDPSGMSEQVRVLRN